VGIVDGIKVGYEAENALMFRYADLLGCDLLGRNRGLYGGYHFSEVQANAGELLKLTRFEGDFRRDPVGKSAGADGDVPDPRAKVVELKEAGLARDHMRTIRSQGAFETY
jgi:hypothetical protein